MPHIPVLLNKILETLGDINGKTIIDTTFGAGGYSRAFLERGASVIAFDRDPSTAIFATELSKKYGDKFIFINDNFSNITNHESRAANHVVFDFGISSMQIDTPARGFSWRFDAPLDMRMSDSGVTAAELIEKSTATELVKILRDYGDVKKATPIARAMKDASPKTTFALRDLIYNPNDVAPVFQALRIAVNDELGEIERALTAVPSMLEPGGMCLCVSFHSLEDRLVKQKFREWTTAPGNPKLPDILSPEFQLLKPIKPDAAELLANPRARSSCLRGVRKIDNISETKGKK